MTGRYLAEFRRPLVIAGIAAVGLVSSYAIAVQRPLPSSEIDLTDLINDAPGWVASALYPVMQMGTFAGPIIVAVLIAVFRRDLVLSAAVVVTGIATWFAAKGVKKVVERGRPLTYMPDIVVREGDGTGLGYISGHSAVAASAAIMAMVALPRRWRPVAAVVAALVGIARIVHGVHLAADVVGGWSFGVLMGLAGLWLAGLVARPTRGLVTGESSAAEPPRIRPELALQPGTLGRPQPVDRLVSAQVGLRVGGPRDHRRHGHPDEPGRQLEIGRRTRIRAVVATRPDRGRPDAAGRVGLRCTRARPCHSPAPTKSGCRRERTSAVASGACSIVSTSPAGTGHCGGPITSANSPCSGSATRAARWPRLDPIMDITNITLWVVAVVALVVTNGSVG